MLMKRSTQHYRRLAVLVTGRTRYQHDRPLLICCAVNRFLKYALAAQPPSALYGSVFVASSSYSSSSGPSPSLLFCFSLRLPHRVDINLPLGNLSPLPPVPFHAAVCCQAEGSYIVPGATLPGAVLIWYTVNRLLWQALATQAASALRLSGGLAKGNQIMIKRIWFIILSNRCCSFPCQNVSENEVYPLICGQS